MTVTTAGHTTMDGYIHALTSGGDYSAFLTDDVVLDMVGTGQSARGRAEVVAFIRYAHQEAFDASLALRSLVVDGDGRRAAVEAHFVGRHIAEFAGIPATGRQVRVPYAVHYDLTDDGISALRIYRLAEGLVSALTD